MGQRDGFVVGTAVDGKRVGDDVGVWVGNPEGDGVGRKDGAREGE